MNNSEADVFLEVKGVSKRFDVGATEVQALSNVDISINRGEFICLIGASGCGKSTLLRIMAGLESPSTGTVMVDGKLVEGPHPERGMVFQDYALFPWMNVRDNIVFGPRQQGKSRAELDCIAAEYLAMVGLEDYADRFPNQLSGGMKQRVSLARVLANKAQLLFMDEPFGALDALTREQLQYELLDICAKTSVTCVFVTHSVEEAVFLADRVVVMTAGPGRIDADVGIQLPRPRTVSAPEFNAIRKDVGDRLTSHLSRRQSVAA